MKDSLKPEGEAVFVDCLSCRHGKLKRHVFKLFHADYFLIWCEKRRGFVSITEEEPLATLIQCDRFEARKRSTRARVRKNRSNTHAR